MRPSRTTVFLAVLAAAVTLAGCGELLGGAGDAGATATRTPVSVPGQTVTVDTAGTVTPNVTGYRSIRPTCTRPPEVVIYLQVAALANNDPATDEGINTTWQFTAPSNRAYTGPYENFADSIREFYRPLLDAETVTFGPLERANGTASRRVTVTTENGTTAYGWRVRRQSDPPFDGCWMMIGIAEMPVASGTTATESTTLTPADR